MKNRNVIAVLLLPFVTFFIYSLVWFVKTKNEMNKMGATIPTAWLIIVPIVNIWWLYKYSEGVDKVTSGSLSTVLTFILLWILGPIGSAIVQNDFNKLAEAGAPAIMPATPVAATVPIENQPPTAPVV